MEKLTDEDVADGIEGVRKEMLDYLAIFKKLNEKGIRYIVTGGIAVNLYGIPRMTYDVDLILDLEDKN